MLNVQVSVSLSAFRLRPQHMVIPGDIPGSHSSILGALFSMIFRVASRLNI